jgi:hypothetical protein
MSNPYTTPKKCKLSKGFLPSFTPEIYSLSVDFSAAGAYSNVLIFGKNFLTNGTTYVNFGTNYTNIPVSYYGSNNISFVVPSNALPGVYDVIVVNNYTSNFGSSINNFYNSNLNYSNSVPYTLT